jgi:hypothetical protein
MYFIICNLLTYARETQVWNEMVSVDGIIFQKETEPRNENSIHCLLLAFKGK